MTTRLTVDAEITKLHAEIERLEAKVAELEETKSQLSELRNYCTLTFGESHPEIKKCPHELKIEELRELIVKKDEVLNFLTGRKRDTDSM